MKFAAATAVAVSVLVALPSVTSASSPLGGSGSWTLGESFEGGGGTGDVVWNKAIEGWRGEAPGYFADAASELTAEKGLVLTVTPNVKIVPAEECACAERNVTLGLAVSEPQYQYGFFEASIELASVDGITSSFWLQGKTGEINIVDYIAGEAAGKQGVHCFNVDGVEDLSVTSSVAAAAGASASAAVYGVDWSSTAVKFYKDGVLTKTISESDDGFACMQQPMSVIFSTEIAGKSVPEGLGAPTSMTAGWYKYWQSSESEEVDPPVDTGEGEGETETETETNNGKNETGKASAASKIWAQIAVTAAAGMLAALF